MKLHKPFAISLMLCLFGTAIPLHAEDLAPPFPCTLKTVIGK